METTLSKRLGHSATGSLAPSEQVRLAGILSRLASPFEGERAPAAVLASAFVARQHLQWSDLGVFARAEAIDPVAVEPPRQSERRAGPGHPGWRGYCRRRRTYVGQSLDVVT